MTNTRDEGNAMFDIRVDAAHFNTIPRGAHKYDKRNLYDKRDQTTKETEYITSDPHKKCAEI